MRHDFLNLISIDQAASSGKFSINDKVGYMLYQKIQFFCTKANAKYGNLLSYNQLQTEMPDVPINKIHQSLKMLTENKLALQLFFYHFNDSINQLIFSPVFVTKPKQTTINVFDLYEALSVESAVSISKYLEKRESSFLSDFSLDLQKDISSDFNVNYSSIVSSLQNIDTQKFEVIPDNNVLNFLLKDIKENLIKNDKVLDIEDFGILPVYENVVLKQYDKIVDFFNDKVSVKYKNEASFYRSFKSISLEESVYNEDKLKPRTSKFNVDKAKALKTCLETKYGSEKTKYAGKLTIESLIKLEKIIEKKLQDEWIEKKEKLYFELKEKILDKNVKWSDLIVTINEEEKFEIPDDVWDKLLSDEQILNTKWNKHKKTLHAFLRKDPKVFELLVNNMIYLSSDKMWQVLLIKSFLDESDDEMSTLFSNKSFTKQYGKILKKAYIAYMPWYFKLFFLFLLPGFKDTSFNHAKTKIRVEQKKYEKENQNYYKRIIESKNSDRDRKLVQIRKDNYKNKITSKLDSYYFSKKISFPDIQTIKKEITEMTEKEFENILKEFYFVSIPVSGNEDIKSRVLYYPKNQDFRSTAQKTIKKIESALLNKNDNDTFDDFDKEKALKIKIYLENELKRSITNIKTEEEDPYKKFSKELDKRVYEKEKW
ncbi:MAG: hypothetical protein OEZ22_12925 [Spirochaetia bacterium]|nr:hypothetical protein [Spirochaetia bacterium]